MRDLGRAVRLAELSAIATSELVEQLRVVVVPLTQFGGRGDLLAPLVEMGPGLAHAARPDPVHEDSGAVLGRRVVIDSSDLDRSSSGHQRPPWSTHASRAAARVKASAVSRTTLARSSAM